MKNRPKFNWRGGLLYALLIEIEVLITAFFLGFAIYPIRMILEEGTLRGVCEVVVFVAIELVVRYLVFSALFKNNRRLDFAYFAQGYLIAFGIRMVFSLLTSFAAFSAGMGVLEFGMMLATSFINPEIKTMQEVPTLLFVVVFTLFEGVSLLVGYLACRRTEEKREKVRKELYGE